MVRCFHLARSYPGAEVLVDVHFAIEIGELVLIAGGTGAGKTTLVRLLLGLDVPRRGWVTVDGRVVGGSSPGALAAHRRRVALVAQGAPLVARMSAVENVALSLTVRGTSAGEARHQAGLVLARLGLEDLAERPAGVLSGGERRWVAIARALVRSDASLLVADEPGADLDETDRILLGTLLEEERARGRTVVVLSREPSLLGASTARVVALQRGRVVEVESHAKGRRASVAEAR